MHTIQRQTDRQIDGQVGRPTDRHKLDYLPTLLHRSNFIHGNYTAYYGQRRASAVGDMKKVVGTIISPGIWNDPRLKFLRPEWFAGIPSFYVHTDIYMLSCPCEIKWHVTCAKHLRPCYVSEDRVCSLCVCMYIYTIHT
jgi:hypothetical protein